MAETVLITDTGTAPVETGTGDLASIAEDIRSANAKAAQSFQEWVTTVGGRLREAQQLLSVNGSHKSEFSRWVKEEFGWEKTRAYRLMDAANTMSLLLPTGNGTLPTSERQCRELARLKDGDKQAVWQEVVESGEPITAALICEKAKAYLPEESAKDCSQPTFKRVCWNRFTTLALQLASFRKSLKSDSYTHDQLVEEFSRADETLHDLFFYPSSIQQGYGHPVGVDELDTSTEVREIVKLTRSIDQMFDDEASREVILDRWDALRNAIFVLAICEGCQAELGAAPVTE